MIHLTPAVWKRLHTRVSTFSLERKSGAKSSIQIQMLRWICRATAHKTFIKFQLFFSKVCQASLMINTAGADKSGIYPHENASIQEATNQYTLRV